MITEAQAQRLATMEVPAPELIKREIRVAARAWLSTHHGPKARPGSGATAQAAHYLEQHPNLYQRETQPETRERYDQWTALLRSWFLSEVEAGQGGREDSSLEVLKR